MITKTDSFVLEECLSTMTDYGTYMYTIGVIGGAVAGCIGLGCGLLVGHLRSYLKRKRTSEES